MKCSSTNPAGNRSEFKFPFPLIDLVRLFAREAARAETGVYPKER